MGGAVAILLPPMTTLPTRGGHPRAHAGETALCGRSPKGVQSFVRAGPKGGHRCRLANLPRSLRS
jgi:hypothetical protein